MKNFIKEYYPGLLNIAIIFISLICFLAPEPAAIIQGEGGWMIVRGIALVWSVIMALGTYSKWIFFGQAISELAADIKNIVSDVEAVKGEDRAWVNSLLDKVSLLAWVICWVVFVQIMATFYVADWCVGGF